MFYVNEYLETWQVHAALLKIVENLDGTYNRNYFYKGFQEIGRNAFDVKKNKNKNYIIFVSPAMWRNAWLFLEF